MSESLSEIIGNLAEARDVRLRMGKVVSVQAGPPRTVTVLIGGTNYPNIVVMDNVSPIANNGVWIADMGVGRWLIIGTTNPGGPAGRLYSGSAFDTPTSSTTLLTVGTSSSIPMYAGRLYRARLGLDCGWYGSSAGDGFTVGIQQDSVDLITCPVYINSSNNYLSIGSLEFAFTTTTANHVFRARAQRDNGSGILQFRGRLEIFDEGPV